MLSDAQLIDLLTERGFLIEQPAIEADGSLAPAARNVVSNAVLRAQGHYGLLEDGDPGPITTRHLVHDGGSFPFCGTVEMATIDGKRPRWDTPWDGKRWPGEPRPRLLTYGYSGANADAMMRVLDWCTAQIARACAVVFQRAPARSANLTYTMGRIDGPGGVLGWNELPVGPAGPNRQLNGKFGASESWHWDPTTPPVRGRVHLGAVALHEMGHGMGLAHMTTERALLNPSYTPSVLNLLAPDIRELALRYGPPISGPAPTPSPVPSEGQVTITIPMDLPAGRYTLTRA